MHAWLCENPVGVDALTWKELPTPAPSAGEVLLEIKAASLNFPDTLIVQNKYQMKPPLPFVPGSEYAGVVQALGAGVTHLKVGQSVACLSGTGGFATHTLAPAERCMPLPPGFSFVDAAAFPFDAYEFTFEEDDPISEVQDDGGMILSNAYAYTDQPEPPRRLDS